MSSRACPASGSCSRCNMIAAKRWPTHHGQTSTPRSHRGWPIELDGGSRDRLRVLSGLPVGCSGAGPSRRHQAIRPIVPKTGLSGRRPASACGVFRSPISVPAVRAPLAPDAEARSERPRPDPRSCSGKYLAHIGERPRSRENVQPSGVAHQPLDAAIEKRKRLERTGGMSSTGRANRLSAPNR